MYAHCSSDCVPAEFDGLLTYYSVQQFVHGGRFLKHLLLYFVFWVGVVCGFVLCACFFCMNIRCRNYD